MREPTYRWVCQKCGEANAAGTSACASCACPAVVSAAELRSPEERRRNTERDAERSSWITLFFPEAVPAAVITASMPFWAISLMAKGYIGTAILVAVGIGGCAFATFWFLKRKEKWGAYLTMLGIFLIAYTAHSITTGTQ